MIKCLLLSVLFCIKKSRVLPIGFVSSLGNKTAILKITEQRDNPFLGGVRLFVSSYNKRRLTELGFIIQRIEKI